MKTSNTITCRNVISGSLVGLALLAGLTGCGSEDRKKLNSPVQAVTTLLQQSDGTVEAELVLISTSVRPNQFIDTATNVRVRVPGGAWVPLTLTSAGHYMSDSNADINLTYQAGETYQFSFDLEDERAKQVSGGNFVAVMTAPGDEPAFEFSKLPEFAGDSSVLTWTPASLYGIITIKNETGDIVYKNFDFSEPGFNGDKWLRLTRTSKTLGVDTFRSAGNYTIEVCTVDKVVGFDRDISSELGALSGFLIGRCAAPQTLAVTD